MESLASKRCVPCEGGVPSLTSAEVREGLSQLDGWTVNAEGRLERSLELDNFRRCVELLDQIAEVAESEQHHPDLHLTEYRKLRIAVWTHAIGGLSENDLILAAKIDELLR